MVFSLCSNLIRDQIRLRSEESNLPGKFVKLRSMVMVQVDKFLLTKMSRLFKDNFLELMMPFFIIHNLEIDSSECILTLKLHCNYIHKN